LSTRHRRREPVRPRSPRGEGARLTPATGDPMISPMAHEIRIEARWDGEANIWLATSPDVPGFVVEAESWSAMIAETRAVLPDLVALNGQTATNLSLVFRAEQRIDLAGGEPGRGGRGGRRGYTLHELLDGVTPQAM